MAVYETIRHGTPDFPLEVHETQVPIGFHLYPHLHAEFEFLVMARGSGILCVDGVSHRLAQGDGAFVNAQSIHLGSRTEPNRCRFMPSSFPPGSSARSTTTP